MPEGRPVIALARGTRARSYSRTEMRMVRPVKTWKDAGGIWKVGVTVRSMVVPCLVKYVPSWAMTSANIRQLNQMGMSWKTNLASSTWFVEQSLQGFLDDASFSSIIIALSRNLLMCVICYANNNSYHLFNLFFNDKRIVDIHTL